MVGVDFAGMAIQVRLKMLNRPYHPQTLQFGDPIFLLMRLKRPTGICNGTH